MPSDETLTCYQVRFFDDVEGLVGELHTVPMALDNAKALAVELSYRPPPGLRLSRSPTILHNPDDTVSWMSLPCLWSL
jgi:hypothetical protein